MWEVHYHVVTENKGDSMITEINALMCPNNCAWKRRKKRRFAGALINEENKDEKESPQVTTCNLLDTNFRDHPRNFTNYLIDHTDERTCETRRSLPTIFYPQEKEGGGHISSAKGASLSPSYKEGELSTRPLPLPSYLIAHCLMYYRCYRTQFFSRVKVIAKWTIS